ncbi:hypothetical protein SEPCBS57363_003574 [Sporothrix epigloea]|uniref:Uncharacterized protein n=1 Tax=Sporothrix epigloea TaxID=1892477 RepID=A0ABP0DQU9_9PEZI
MASPSPIKHATNINIPQPINTTALAPGDKCNSVQTASPNKARIPPSDTSAANAGLPPFVFPTRINTTALKMDTSAGSSPFVNSITNTPPLLYHDDNRRGHYNSNSQENVSPHAIQSPDHASVLNTKSTSPPVMTATARPPSASSSSSMTGRKGRTGSRILSGSELSPLKILQGRVTTGPTPSSATSSATVGSPGSTDSGAESHRDVADEHASSTPSSPPPSYPPAPTRRMSTSGHQLPPALPLGRTPRKPPGTEKRFPVKISVPSSAVASASVSVASSGTASPVGPRSPKQLPVQHLIPPSPAIQPMPSSPSQQPGQVMFAQIQQQQKPLHGRQMSLDEAIQLNEGLKQAIEVFEDETRVIEDDAAVAAAAAQKYRTKQQLPSRRRDSHSAANSSAIDDEAYGMDDTVTSTFSTFSAVPDMAMLSRLNSGSVHGSSSPNKPPSINGHGHRKGGSISESRTPRGGPAPNRTGHYEHGNTTSLLMDFTEQLRLAHLQQLSPSKAQFGAHNGATNGTSAAVATPQRKSLVNLLDFDIPPLPTPRSIPTVTPRELESLKSNFLSEISSLKATLSGKEAEVLALKTAVGDAETRVGECMEKLREERGSRDLLTEEKNQWERRGREMEDVLGKVKGEIVMGHRERDELEAKLDEADKRREAAEMMAQEAETKMAAMRAGRASAEAENNKSRASGSGPSPSSASVQREVEIAVERVARELHTAYKAKHETKVAALKKSYETRWEKRVHELETVAEALAEENEKLRIGRDATPSKMVPSEEERRIEDERRLREARDAAQIKELGAEVNKLEAVVSAVKADNSELRTLLEQERVEKGELVSLAEEMMSMQQSFIASSAAPSSAAAPSAAPTPAPSRTHTAVQSSGYGQPSGHVQPSPRKPKTPAPSRSSATSISRPPSSAGTNRTSTAVNNNKNTNNSSDKNSNNATTAGAASTATTPARSSRPMSVHSTGGRLSGLKPPSSSTMSTGGVPSRIGRISHDRKMSGSGGSLPRPPSGLGTHSGLMSSIEKMGKRGRE